MTQLKNILRSLACASLLALSCPLVPAAVETAVTETEKTFIDLLNDLNAQTFSGSEDNGWTCETPQEYYAGMTKQALNPSRYFKHQFCFNLFNEGFVPHSSERELPYEVIENLSLLCGSHDHKERYVVNSLNRSVSSLGKVALMLRLCHITTNQTILTKRQQAIKALLDSPQTQKSLRSALKTLADHEDVMLSLWHNFGPLSMYQERIKDLCTLPLSQNSSANAQYPNLLTACNMRTMVVPFVEFGLTAASGCALLYVGAHNLLGKPTTGIREDILEDADFNEGYTCTEHQLLWRLWPQLRSFTDTNSTTNGVIKIICGLMIFWNAYSQGNQIMWQVMHNKLLNFFVLHIAATMQSLHTIYSIVKQTPELAQLPDLAPLINFFDVEAVNNKEIKELVTRLATYNLKQKPSPFHHVGGAIRCYLLLLKNKKLMAQTLAAAGMVDMYSGTVQLLQEQPLTRSDSAASFCLPQYLTNSTPIVESSDFWHPMISPTTAVPNSIILGSNSAACHALIFGKNAGGKSTVLKALALNIVMGQSLGIAAASSLSFTPFITFQTFMNIRDDISGGVSLFKNQVIRAKQLDDAVTTADNYGKLSCTLYDEPCNGTDSRAGSAIAYHILKRLANVTTNCTLVASHYPRMKYLETETNGLVNTYHVSNSEPLFKLSRYAPLTSAPVLPMIADYEREDLQEVVKILHDVQFPYSITTAVTTDLGLA